MSEIFDIQSYMTRGAERVVVDIIKATLRNPGESAYMVKFALASRAASKKRRKAEEAGEYIPPFLYRQHYQPVQSALRGMLFQVQSRYS